MVITLEAAASKSDEAVRIAKAASTVRVLREKAKFAEAQTVAEAITTVGAHIAACSGRQSRPIDRQD